MNYKTAISIIKSQRQNDLLFAESVFIDALRTHDDLRETEKQIRSIQSMKNRGLEVDESNLSALNEKKRQILERIGLTDEIISPPPRCRLCGDTGMGGSKACKCVIDMVGGSVSSAITFEDFDFGLFSDNDLKTVRFTYDTARAFCDKFPNTNTLNLIFYGKTGTGKTFLAMCIADAVAKKGYSVLFISAFDFVNRMLSYHTAPVGEKLEHMQPLLDCDLLIIDDLGTESMLKNVTVEYFSNVLNERLRAKRHTLITTNLDDAMLAARYGERVASRLFDKRLSRGFALSSKDLRKK